MLSKNSSRFTPEEVETLKRAIIGIEVLEKLQKNDGAELQDDEAKEFYKIQLIGLIGTLIRFFLNPETIKMIHHLLS